MNIETRETAYLHTYGSITEMAEYAMTESAHLDETVHIHMGGMDEDEVADLMSELMSECDDYVENGSVTEYWGEDEDGREWRVHVTR